MAAQMYNFKISAFKKVKMNKILYMIKSECCLAIVHSTKQIARHFLTAGVVLVCWCLSTQVRASTEELDGRVLDELIGKYVSSDQVPGAAAVLVRKNGDITRRGYGVVDLAAQNKVNPDTTIFRIGSISKTFTAIAILQLMDEGKITLESDANLYLKGVQIPKGDGTIRIIDLLTHRAGFDGDLTYVGTDNRLAAADSSDQRLQRDIFRVRPAGVFPSYDNMAWGLLGHIIESVDGIPYSQAIARRIFIPLGMTKSMVGLPLDGSNVAVPYEVGSDGKPHAKPQIFLRRGWQGAGEISTTAGDMVHFLQAMLSDGAYPGGKLLKEETFRRQVDTSHFGFHPKLGSTGLGVYGLGTMQGNGFGHGGTIRGFNASLVVLPKQGIAFFGVMNLNSPMPEMTLPGLFNYIAHPPAHTDFDPTEYMTIELPSQLERKFQLIDNVKNLSNEGTRDATDWSGRYAGLRMESYEGLFPRLAATILLQPKIVRNVGDGTIFIGTNGPYRQIEKGLFSLGKSGGPLTQTIGFAQVGTNILMGPHTLQASRRLEWYERVSLTAGGILLAPLLLIAVALLHRRQTTSRQRKTDLIMVLSTFMLFLVIFIDMSFASFLYRIENLGWVVSFWRIGMVFALLTMILGASYTLANAFYRLPQERTTDHREGRLYSLVIALLSIWILFAAVYWDIFGNIF